jgi:hypothetical protein
MNRNERRLATKKAIATGAATSFADLRRNVEKLPPGEPAMAVIDGWRIGYSVHPKLGNHLSVSKISPTASEATLQAARLELQMPDNAKDCSYTVTENGIMHWHWGTWVPSEPVTPTAYEVEVHADVAAIGQEWLNIAFAAASAGADLADKLGVSTSGAHFSLTTPGGEKACIHMTRPGEAKTPPHTVH